VSARSTCQVICGLLVSVLVALPVASRAQEAPGLADAQRDVRSPDPDVRRRALRALADSGSPSAIGPLSALARDQVDDIQIEALYRLVGLYVAEPVKNRRYIGPVEVRNDRLARAAFDRGPYGLVPQPQSADAAENLIWAMADDNERIRLEAIYTLGIVAEPPVGDRTALALARALEDSEWDAREAAARVAGRLRAQAAGDALIAAINDRRLEVKTAAMRALGDLRETRALQALTEQLAYYERGKLGEAAADGLARIGHPSSDAIFRECLADRSAGIRRYAMEGLARIGGSSTSEVVARLGVERDPHARLAGIFVSVVAGGDGRELVSALGEERLAAQAMGYLGELGPKSLPLLTSAVGHDDPRVRERAAMVLGRVGGAEALTALERAKRDPQVEVARAAERAVARLRLISR
jgi:HEAT repeat protein